MNILGESSIVFAKRVIVDASSLSADDKTADVFCVILYHYIAFIQGWLYA